jgi:hypothetical protein
MLTGAVGESPPPPGNRFNNYAFIHAAVPLLENVQRDADTVQ